ncbi:MULTISPECIES: DUF4279 domain-containing protein [unclassified Microbacterium]|uniref:DUF4279 domain-containing protein n=1 Tax=unclassified Microbacterium TaxID=2609290 RepID=UPI003015FD91
MSLAEIIDITQEDPDDGWSLGDMYKRQGMLEERPRTFSSWKRRSTAGQGGSVQDSLDGLFLAVSRIAPRIANRPELRCELQIVQYFSKPARDIGFHLDAPWLATLASVPASIDVDQYR